MKKPLLIIIAGITLVVAVAAFLRFAIGGPEDEWLCQGGQWVKHGNPSAAKPTTGCGNANTSVNSNLPAPNVTYETNTTQSPLYLFDTVKEWTSIAPEEIQKSITQEQRHGYEIVYFASNSDAVTFSVSEKKSSELKNITAIVADDKSVAQTNQSITWVDQKLGLTDAQTELKQVAGTTDYTVFSRYLIIASSAGETRWALMEVAVPSSRTSQYQTVVSHLLDSLKLNNY